MTIRDYITVDWTQSPRIVNADTAGNPQSEITVQDLYDTLRDLASKDVAMDDDEIVDAGGKEGGVVAVTMTLNNAQVKFTDTGTPRTCKISGGNIFAVDADGYDMSPVAYNTNVTVGYAQSTAAALAWNTIIDDIKTLTDGIKVDTDDLQVQVGEAQYQVAGVQDDVDTLSTDVGDLKHNPDNPGTYDPHTDSLEAIRDRGDEAWTGQTAVEFEEK